MGGQDKSGQSERREEIFSKAVRAGKRTYFFDVKATRNEDFYLTITESKKVFESEGKFKFEKHKIFLYREDFDKFSDGLKEAVSFIRDIKPEEPMSEEEFTNVSFDDLED